MATIEQYLTKYLDERGLWPNETKAIMVQFKASGLAKSMENRWNESADEYPIVLKTTLAVSLNYVVVEWIDKNAPQHWARGMFASS